MSESVCRPCAAPCGTLPGAAERVVRFLARHACAGLVGEVAGTAIVEPLGQERAEIVGQRLLVCRPGVQGAGQGQQHAGRQEGDLEVLSVHALQIEPRRGGMALFYNSANRGSLPQIASTFLRGPQLVCFREPGKQFRQGGLRIARCEADRADS